MRTTCRRQWPWLTIRDQTFSKLRGPGSGAACTSSSTVAATPVAVRASEGTMAKGAVRVSNSTIAAEPADTLQSVYARTYARVFGYYPPPSLHESPPSATMGRL